MTGLLIVLSGGLTMLCLILWALSDILGEIRDVAQAIRELKDKP